MLVTNLMLILPYVGARKRKVKIPTMRVYGRLPATGPSVKLVLIRAR